MKKYFSIAFILLVCLYILAQTPEEKNVWSRVEALTKAIFETKDSAALVELVSTKVTYGHSGGNVEDKATMIQKAVSSKTTYRNSVLEKVSIDVDGNTAVLRHNFRATSVENGNETPLNLGIIQVWRKENNKWRIWARQAVRIAQPN
jgi:ketosteroid isomerase-like protein